MAGWEAEALFWRADNWERPFGSSFEGGPESGLWRMLEEFDVINHYYERRELHDGSVVEDTMPLGFNTGLEQIRYRPACLDDDRYTGLQEAMQQFDVSVEQVRSFLDSVTSLAIFARK